MKGELDVATEEPYGGREEQRKESATGQRGRKVTREKTAASSSPRRASRAFVVHNRDPLSAVHFGRQLCPSMALKLASPCHSALSTSSSALFYRPQGRFGVCEEGRFPFSSHTRASFSYPWLSRLLGLPLAEGQSRGSRRWAGLAEGHCVMFYPVKLGLLSFLEKFPAGESRRTDVVLLHGALRRERSCRAIRTN